MSFAAGEGTLKLLILDTSLSPIRAEDNAIERILNHMDWQSGWIRQRTIQIFSDIDNNMAQQVVQQIIGFAAHSDDPVSIQINTRGGQVLHALAITQIMEAVSVPVYTLALGQVYSAGVIVLAAGTKRSALFGTNFLVHEFRTGSGDAPYSSVLCHQRCDEWVYQRLLNFFHAHTKLTKDVIKNKFLSQDYYFDETEALSMGLIDKVVSTIEIKRIQL